MKIFMNTSSIILTSASVLVLSACLPQEEAAVADRELERIESQVQLYSKAFQQYSGRSLNAAVNSSAWQTGSLPEGVINLAALAPNMNLGGAGDYLSSAHCRDTGSDPKSYHITWFDNADSDGNLSLKGLGRSHVGQTNMRIKSMMSHSNFGVYDGTKINMVDGTTFTLTGGCSTINLPIGTAVSAISMKLPDNIAVPVETRTILKAESCPSGQVGGITQSIMADFYAEDIPSAPGKRVQIATSNYNDEEDAIMNHTSGWATISNDCIDGVESAMLDGNIEFKEVVDVSALSAMNLEIKNAIAETLGNVDCRVVGEVDEDGNTIDKNSNDDAISFETCDDSVNLDMLDNASISEKILLNSVVEVIQNKCPAIPNAGTKTVTISGNDYPGLPSSAMGTTTTLKFGNLTGDMVIEKTTKNWQVLTDLGNGIPSNYDDVYGTCKTNVPECQNVDTFDYFGKSVNCTSENTLRLPSCEGLYPALTLKTSNITALPKGLTSKRNVYERDFVKLFKSRGYYPDLNRPEINNVGPTYSREAGIYDWNDSDTLEVQPYGYKPSSSWRPVSSAPISCTYVQTKTEVISDFCKHPDKGSASFKLERQWTATGLGQTPQWSEWEAVDGEVFCKTGSDGGQVSSGPTSSTQTNNYIVNNAVTVDGEPVIVNNKQDAERIQDEVNNATQTSSSVQATQDSTTVSSNATVID